ncbi:hypothetical protein OQA88_5039 [Cercophora sp. LCS_1]
MLNVGLSFEPPEPRVRHLRDLTHTFGLICEQWKERPIEIGGNHSILALDSVDLENQALRYEQEIDVGDWMNQSFRFRTRLVSATSTPVDSHHPDVLRLRLNPSRTAYLIGWLATLVPWIKSGFPEWFLAPNVIIKREKTDQEAVIAKELFDTETQAYERLKDLQGLVVPICYGQVRCNGRRALVLQDVGGVSVAEPAGATLNLEELSRLLQECCHALRGFGVHQSDFQCGNFRLVGSKLMALDFEMAEFDLSEDDSAFFTATGISHLLSAYQRSRAFFRGEGWLEAA